MLLPIDLTLMESHRVRKRNSKNVVVARCEALENIRQNALGIPRQLIDSRKVLNCQNQNFKGPDSPEGNQYREEFVLANHSGSVSSLQAQVRAKHTLAASVDELEHRALLACRMVGHVLVGPDLAVRMWVAGPHHLAPVLEDLDVTHPINRS